MAIAPTSLSQNDRIEQYEFILSKEMKDAQFKLFVEHLGLKESNNHWRAVNPLGCIGKWQFSHATLSALGYGDITAGKFNSDSLLFPLDLQFKVLLTLFKINESLLSDYMNYVGDTIGGVLITKSGMLAAAHLGGAGSVQMYLLSNGRINNHDINNTSIKNYLAEFSGYDIE
jgi:hypothetical protein